MRRAIHLGPLSFPLEFITLRTALYGASGAGKTTVARLVAEQVHAAGLRFCAIDLKNDWWGLKASADGTAEGIPAVIFGGPRKDVALLDTAGAVVAETIASIEQSAILDLDAFSKTKQLKFLSVFLERLYDVNRHALLMICDEADRYASQKPMTSEGHDALGASEDIARRARKRGIGSLWVTQRTAVLNKNVADLCDMTVVFRTPGVTDLDELEKRVGRFTTKDRVREIMAIAPSLENGQAIFLTTHPLLRKSLPDGIRPVQLPLPATFDSSATPGVRRRRREPKVLAQADLSAIEQQMADTIEQQQRQDPRHLERQIAEKDRRIKELERTHVVTKTGADQNRPTTREAARADKVAELKQELARHRRALEQAMRIILKIKTLGFDVESADGRKQLEAAIAAAVGTVMDPIEKRVRTLVGQVEKARAAATEAEAEIDALLKQNIGLTVDVEKRAPFAVTTPTPPRARPVGMERVERAEGDATESEARVLDSLAWWLAAGVAEPSRRQVAFVARYSVNGRFNNLLGGMRSRGWVDYPKGDHVALSDEGRKRAAVPSTPSRREFLDRVREVIRKPKEIKVFDVVVEAGRELSREELAELTGYTVNGRFNNILGRLRSLGVLEYPRGNHVALGEMFNTEAFAA